MNIRELTAADYEAIAAVHNAPIRELNQRLGFVPRYDLIRYEIYHKYKETQQ